MPSVMISAMGNAGLKRRWPQYRLQTLLLLVALLAVLLSWVRTKLGDEEQERAAAAAVKKMGGEAWWGHRPLWLRSIAGQYCFEAVVGVRFRGMRATDAALQVVESLGQLESLYLTDCDVTDAGLGRLSGLHWLTSLSLDGTRITDAGLEHLKGLGRLESLGLSGTRVTDAGLEQLRGLKHLELMDLDDTGVTAAGVKKLRLCLPKCHIDEMTWAEERH